MNVWRMILYRGDVVSVWCFPIYVTLDSKKLFFIIVHFSKVPRALCCMVLQWRG